MDPRPAAPAADPRAVANAIRLLRRGEPDLAVRLLNRAAAALPPGAALAVAGDDAAEADHLANALFRRALGHWRAGSRDAAAEIYGALAAFDPTARLIAGRDAPPPPADPEAVLAEAARAWAAGETPPPDLAAAQAAPDEAAVLARWRGRKVLVATRRRYLPEPDARPCEITEYLTGSAAAVGLQPRWLDADDLVFFFQAGAARQDAVLAALAQACRDWRPDVLVIDCFVQPDGRHIPAARLIAFLRRLRAESGVRVVAFLTDPWEAPQQAALRIGPACADLLWHFHPSSPAAALPAVAARTVYRMQPLPDLGHAPARPERTGGAAFVGSIIRHPQRALWFAELARLATPVEAVLSGHRAGDPGPAPTMEAYAELLGTLRANVNFTRLGLHVNPANGRIFRAALSGCLALEEDNPDTPRFFAPYVHYVPFRSAPELDAWLRFFAARDDWRLRIAEAGQAWCRRWYSQPAVWAAILARLEDAP